MHRLWAALTVVIAGAALATAVVGQSAAPPQPLPTSKKVPVKRVAKPAMPKGPIVEAKTVFGSIGTPAPLAPRAIGFYSKGCLAGAQPLPIDGPVWQAMRLSRNRNWGHPNLIALVERLAIDAKAKDGWPGLLVGDISQPRGGPMLTGHASHQVGLDADIWLTPMPDRRLSAAEREELAATSMLGDDGILVDPKVWTPAHARLIVRAASYPEVDRMFVHPGIKKALCLEPGIDRTNLWKIQPYYGHYYHMHIRISCPPGSGNCRGQPGRPSDDGCGREVDQWIANFRKAASQPKVAPDPNAKPVPPKPGMGIDQLPAECRMVIDAGATGTLAGAIAKAKGATAANGKQ